MAAVTPAEQFLVLGLLLSAVATVAVLLGLFGWKFMTETVRRLREEEDPS